MKCRRCGGDGCALCWPPGTARECPAPPYCPLASAAAPSALDDYLSLPNATTARRLAEAVPALLADLCDARAALRVARDALASFAAVDHAASLAAEIVAANIGD